MSDSEEQYLFLMNKLLQRNLSEEEKIVLFDLADDDEKVILLQYLLDQSDKQEELESEIVYEKTKPNDLISSDSFRHDEFPKNTIKSLMLKVISIAASILILFFAGIYIYNLSTASVEEWRTITTKKGERKFLTFNDGTEVWLNNDSELKVLNGYGSEHRKMVLKGEGFFSVAKNKNLPFVVKTKDTEVNVLGTVFNLSAYPDDNSTTTSLIEGKVVLKLYRTERSRDIVLLPGDQVKIAKNNPVISSSIIHNQELTDDITYKKVDVDNHKISDMLWIENKLVFNDEPLSEIVQKLERWYGKTILVQNKDFLKLSFSGVFEERNCTDVLDYLKETSGAPINYYVKNDIIYIK